MIWLMVHGEEGRGEEGRAAADADIFSLAIEKSDDESEPTAVRIMQNGSRVQTAVSRPALPNVKCAMLPLTPRTLWGKGREGGGGGAVRAVVEP